MTPAQGEIWWAEAEDKRRPVLVVSRTQSAQHLNRVIVAPITRTIRGIPTEIALDESHGLNEPCVASFDSLSPQLVALDHARRRNSVRAAGDLPGPRSFRRLLTNIV